MAVTMDHVLQYARASTRINTDVERTAGDLVAGTVFPRPGARMTLTITLEKPLRTAIRMNE